MSTDRPYEKKWQNYYAILGVRPNASALDIKSAYRRLARKYHPDRTSDASTTIKMAIINEAYEILSDTSRRLEYDKAFGNMYSAQRERTNSRMGSTPGSLTHTMRASVAIDENERRLSWLKFLVLFCLFFLVGISICVIREQVGWTGIWLSLLWAVLAFWVVVILRALFILIVDLAREPAKRKDIGGWGIIVMFFIELPVAAFSGFFCWRILHILLFEAVAK